jgi:hypothetical protein
VRARGVAGAGLALGLVVALAGAAQAARIDFEASELGGGSVEEVDLGPGVLAFDPAFPAIAPMRLVIEVEAGDAGAPLAWNALVDNLTGALWGEFSIELEGVGFELVGTVAANAGVVAGVNASAGSVLVRFAPPGEAAGLDIGAAAGTGTDWTIDLGADPPPSFAMVLTPVAAPEPGSGAAALAAAGALALLRSRGRLSPRRRGRRAAR